MKYTEFETKLTALKEHSETVPGEALAEYMCMTLGDLLDLESRDTCNI